MVVGSHISNLEHLTAPRLQPVLNLTEVTPETVSDGVKNIIMLTYVDHLLSISISFPIFFALSWVLCEMRSSPIDLVPERDLKFAQKKPATRHAAAAANPQPGRMCITNYWDIENGANIPT